MHNVIKYRQRELSSMEACRVRYGNTTSGIGNSKLVPADIIFLISDAQMKQISSKMAEASIKFDLLSVDPKCPVCGANIV